MQTLSEYVIDAGLANRMLRDQQLARLLPGTSQRRHNLVNRALKSSELVRLRRGLYVLDTRLRDYQAHPFVLAQALAPGSYVSFETALAYHDWIPEAVTVTASVTPGRKSQQLEHTSLGEFSFHPLAITAGCFLTQVERQDYHGQAFLIAKPLRALMDLVCLRKVEWQGLSWLTQGLRIDEERLSELDQAEVNRIVEVYKHQRVKRFAGLLAEEITK
jgi:predicted transcriptional regulator of viral defense system